MKKPSHPPGGSSDAGMVRQPPPASTAPGRGEGVGSSRNSGRRANGVMDDAPQVAGLISAFEERITRVHVDPDLLMDGHENRIDPPSGGR